MSTEENYRIVYKGKLFERYNNKTFHEAGFDSLVTGCVFIAVEYFQMFVEKGKDKNVIESIKSKPFTCEFSNKSINLIACHTYKQYSLRLENVQENLENNEYFLTNTLYFELDKPFAINLEDLARIFVEWGDINVRKISFIC